VIGVVCSRGGARSSALPRHGRHRHLLFEYTKAERLPTAALIEEDFDTIQQVHANGVGGRFLAEMKARIRA
jgi:hypothetical protein